LNDQEAATLWYHDHAMGITRLNVYAGLAGFTSCATSARHGCNATARGRIASCPRVIASRDTGARHIAEAGSSIFEIPVMAYGMITL